MSKRSCTHIKELPAIVQAMAAERMTQRETAEHFGIKDQSAVKFALLRARKSETITPKFRDRKPAKTLQEYKHENKRLKMETGKESRCGVAAPQRPAISIYVTSKFEADSSLQHNVSMAMKTGAAKSCAGRGDY